MASIAPISRSFLPADAKADRRCRRGSLGCRRALRLVLLLWGLAGCHPSRGTVNLEDFFPDSTGQRRSLSVHGADGHRTQYTLQTRVADRRQAGRLGLEFTDPAHAGLLGRYQVLVSDSLVELVLMDLDLRLPLLAAPLQKDSLWQEARPGFQSLRQGWQAPDSLGRVAFLCDYRISADLLAQFRRDPGAGERKLSLWLVPGLGPIRITADTGYREEWGR
jgi:hypothetical protein